MIPSTLVKVVILLRTLISATLRKLHDRAPNQLLSTLAAIYIILLRIKPEGYITLSKVREFLKQYRIQIRWVDHEIIADYIACYNVVVNGKVVKPGAAKKS
ncbi:MAG: hypothetical protein DRJ40_10535 [Thermoprotei archaeon]|nr:MAG: hypothetical protein DRJ40_10535 [Thermoprotei archaeon]